MAANECVESARRMRPSTMISPILVFRELHPPYRRTSSRRRVPRTHRPPLERRDEPLMTRTRYSGRSRAHRCHRRGESRVNLGHWHPAGCPARADRAIQRRQAPPPSGHSVQAADGRRCRTVGGRHRHDGCDARRHRRLECGRRRGAIDRGIRRDDRVRRCGPARRGTVPDGLDTARRRHGTVVCRADPLDGLGDRPPQSALDALG